MFLVTRSFYTTKILFMKSLAIVFVASIYLTSCGESSSKTDAAATSEQKTEEQSLPVSSKEYYKKYQENEVAADNLYKGKKLAITGTVESVSKDIADDVYVSLAGDGEISLGVQCHLSDAGKAASVKKGSSITIVGTGEGMILGIPQVKDCAIQ